MPWWESWFGEEYLELYPQRDLTSAELRLVRGDMRDLPFAERCGGTSTEAPPAPSRHV